MTTEWINGCSQAQHEADSDRLWEDAAGHEWITPKSQKKVIDDRKLSGWGVGMDWEEFWLELCIKREWQCSGFWRQNLRRLCPLVFGRGIDGECYRPPLLETG